MIKVVIVTEFRFYAESLARFVGSLPDFCIAGIFCRPSVAVADILAAKPDVVLLDCRSEDARWLVGRLRAGHRDLEMIALGVADSAEDIIGCATAGFSGFLPAGSGLAELGPILHSAIHGQLRCSPRITKALFLGLSRLAEECEEEQPRASRLTDREQQILSLIARGCSNKEIAQDLSISYSTVKNHVHSILTKLQVLRRADAVSLRRHAAMGSRARPGALPPVLAPFERQEAEPSFL